MSEIVLKCVNHVMTLVNTPDISSGNVNYDTVRFELCPNWTGFTKTAVFYRSEDEVYYQLLNDENRCTIPKEVLQSKGKIRIGLFGVKDDTTITSDVITYNVREGAITENIKPSDPTPDIYAQILAVAVGDNRKILDSLAITNARIDNLASLEEGSTTGDAELLDIRVDANGNTHSSAGTAVREQVSKLSSEIVDTSYWNMVGNNQAYNANWVQGNYSNPQNYDDTVIHPSPRRISAKIELSNVVKGVDIGFLKDGYSMIVYVYDENKNVLGSVTDYRSEYHTELNIKSLCVTIKKNDDSEIKPEEVINTNIYLVEKDTPVTFDNIMEKISFSESNIVTLTTTTDLYEKIIYINPNKVYLIDVSIMQGRSLDIYTLKDYDGAVYEKTDLINVESGVSHKTVYQMGNKYLIANTFGCKKIKIVSQIGYSNYMVLNLIECPYTPFIPTCVNNTKYLEKPTYKSGIIYANVMKVLNGYAYACTGGNNIIYKINLSTSEESVFYEFPSAVSNFTVFDNENILAVLYPSNKMYLLENGILTEKHTFQNGDMSLIPNPLFSYFTYKNIGIVSEYNSKKEPISGYKAYITKDYGHTWNVLFDLTEHIPSGTDLTYHLHSVVYDNYQNMYWAVTGDSTNTQMVYYSLNGIAWHKCCERVAIKTTVIVPMRDCVLFISDSNQVGIYKWVRKDIQGGDTLHFDDVKMFIHEWGGACPIGCRAYYDEVKDLVFFAYDTDENINSGYNGNEFKYGNAFVTDGYRVSEIYKTDDITTCTGVSGDSDYIVLSNKSGSIIMSR